MTTPVSDYHWLIANDLHGPEKLLVHVKEVDRASLATKTERF